MNDKLIRDDSEKIPALILTSILASYPGDYFRTHVSDLIKDIDKAKLLDDLRNDLRILLESDEELDNLRSDYIDIFDRSQKATPLYETEYGKSRSFFKGNDLADISGFYKAFGFEHGEEDMAPEMQDHISVELEFYSLLLMKEAHLKDNKDEDGAAIVLDARKKFLNDHLGRFAKALNRQDVIKFHPFYNKVFHLNAKLIENECLELGIEIKDDELIFENDTEASEVMNCADGAGCIKGLK